MKREDLFFHESTVLEFTHYLTSINLRLEDIHVGEQIANVELLFEGIKTLEIDHQPATFPFMVAPDGEVLTLKLNDNKAELLIEWNDSINHDQFIKFYFMEFEEVFIKITDSHQLSCYLKG